MNGPTTTLRRLTVPQWFVRLTEYLPEAYIDGRQAELISLYLDGATPSLAAVYCRAYLFAPRIELMD